MVIPNGPLTIKKFPAIDSTTVSNSGSGSGSIRVNRKLSGNSIIRTLSASGIESYKEKRKISSGSNSEILTEIEELPPLPTEPKKFKSKKSKSKKESTEEEGSSTEISNEQLYEMICGIKKNIEGFNQSITGLYMIIENQQKKEVSTSIDIEQDESSEETMLRYYCSCLF